MATLEPGVYENAAQLPNDFKVADLPAMPYPDGVLLCPPTYFDVIDVKNQFMQDRAGSVDRAEARRQWTDLKSAFERAGARTRELSPLPNCEDMVFCANPAFLGTDALALKTCVPGTMTYPSRQDEVAAITAWCAAEGYRIVEPDDKSIRFEGGGDAIWHPGRRLIWGGHGQRTDPRIYPSLARTFGAPVLTIELTSPTYYHLDTAFCAIDQRTALVYPPAFADAGMALIRQVFDVVVEVTESEAQSFACNGSPLFGRTVILDRRCAATAQTLRRLGYDVVEVDTGEFLKSGGSAYCMKCGIY